MILPGTSGTKGTTQERRDNMKYRIILSIVSLIATAVITLLTWWIWGCPRIQSDTDAFLLALITITLYYALESAFARKEENEWK